MSNTTLDQHFKEWQNTFDKWVLHDPDTSSNFAYFRQTIERTTKNSLEIADMLNWGAWHPEIKAALGKLIPVIEADEDAYQDSLPGSKNKKDAFHKQVFSEKRQPFGHELVQGGVAGGLAKFVMYYPCHRGESPRLLDPGSDDTWFYINACWQLRRTRHQVAVNRFQAGTACASDYHALANIARWTLEFRGWLQGYVCDNLPNGERNPYAQFRVWLQTYAPLAPALTSDPSIPLDGQGQAYAKLWRQMMDELCGMADVADYDSQGNIWTSGTIWLKPHGRDYSRLLQYRQPLDIDNLAHGFRIAHGPSPEMLAQRC